MCQLNELCELVGVWAVKENVLICLGKKRKRERKGKREENENRVGGTPNLDLPL